MGCSQSTPKKVETKGWAITEDNAPQYDTAKGPFHVNRTNERREIPFAKSGPGSEAECPPITFSAMFRKAAEKKKDKVAMCIELPTPPLNSDGTAPPSLPLEQWKKWTWGEYYDECYNVAKALLALGAEKFSGGAIYGVNSPYWIFSQMSCVLAGVLPAGIYPTDTVEQIEYKTKYSDSVVAFCGEEKHYNTFASRLESTPKIKALVAWAFNPPVSEIKRQDGTVVKVYTWDQFLAFGKEQSNEAVDKRIAEQDARDCAGLVFTSGTTGKPKAVMLSHDNLCFQAKIAIDIVPGLGEGEERSLSYLPLSHVAGQEVDIVLPMSMTANRPGFHTLYFARGYDLKAGSLGDRLRFVKPTTFLGVPRVWEKIAEKIRAKGAQTKGLKKKVATFAKKKGLEYEMNLQLGGSGVKPKYYDFVNKKVLTKVKEALGLQECKVALTGAAPMARELQEYFGSLGICILDNYGMSECGGVATGNSREVCQWGTVGQMYPGTEARVFRVDENDINIKTEAPAAKDFFNPTEEEQGELCYRGRHIMMGYYANPSLGEEHVAEIEKKNAETIDNEGYLHSGDKSTRSEQNMFRITGRYKELIIGAGGENISPGPVEDHVKTLAPGVSNIVMIGNNLKFNVALVTLRAKGATGELPGGDELDPDVLHYGSEGTTKISEAIKDKAWIKHVQDAIEATNKDGSVCHSNAWKIQKFTILPRDLSIVGLELTPTLKTKRSYIDDKYKQLIAAMMESKEPYFECTPELVPAQEQPAEEGVLAKVE